MVKKLAVFFAYVLFFILALMYFTPKISAYYFLEQQAKPFGLLISKEKLSDTGFSLNIEDASVSFKSIESANIKNTNIKVFGIYNSVSLENIALSSAAASFVPLNVDVANISYTVFSPLSVNAYINGEFGEAQAIYDIVQNAIHIELIPSKKMLKKYRSTLTNLKKQKSGEYIYDQAF